MSYILHFITLSRKWPSAAAVVGRQFLHQTRKALVLILFIEYTEDIGGRGAWSLCVDAAVGTDSLEKLR